MTNASGARAPKAGPSTRRSGRRRSVGGWRVRNRGKKSRPKAGRDATVHTMPGGIDLVVRNCAGQAGIKALSLARARTSCRRCSLRAAAPCSWSSLYFVQQTGLRTVRVGSFADAKGQVAGMGGDLAGEVEEGEPQFLGARSGQGDRQGKRLHCARLRRARGPHCTSSSGLDFVQFGSSTSCHCCSGTIAQAWCNSVVMSALMVKPMRPEGPSCRASSASHRSTPCS